jgi:multidrug resistance efflux pump
MAKRIVGIAALVAALILSLVLSQRRTQPLKVSGFIEAYEIRVGSRVGGRVATVAAREGDVVTSGALLIELEPYDLRERRAQTAAELQSARAQLAKLEAGFRREEIAQAKARRDGLAARLQELVAGPRRQEIATARARVDAAAATLRLAESEFARAQNLHQSKIEPQEKLDQATQNVQASRADLRARQEELALLEAGTRPEQIAQARAQLEEAEQAWKLEQAGYRPEEVAQALAAVAAAEAALAAIDRQLEELRVRAPLTGRVEAVDLRPGDLVTAGAPVLSLMDLSELWVRAYVPENHLDLKVGRRVWVTVDSFPGRRFAARVTFVARQAEFTPSNVQTPEDRAKQVFRIKATLEKGSEDLRPGMAADVWLEGEPAGTAEGAP